ncbi:hypothetical protein GTW51_07040 [Aurantimonas aggregata]|uniref:Ceramidase n=1 Tax=Aurantimonas aggregata TaxID=2047720 RepID=A0A6L9MF02_9HYPH|nr:ceramidase domain-containing protein [Aurantimonas aggregata]NDV86453.1 hypothetical protein [Aurantimonas aggregata]
MGWTEAIDGYCERTSDAFWAEPINAITNLAFLLAALIGFSLWRRAGRRDAASLFLVVLVAVIGVGSFLFHTFANRWSSLADVVPIAVFIYAYFGMALVRFVGLLPLVAGLATLAFLGASFIATPLLAPLAGSSSGYVPALLALVGIGGGLTVAGQAQGRLVLMAGGVFALSLAFRIGDQPLCADWPLGTHFAWHILNATTLGLLLVAAIRGAPQSPERSDPGAG